MNWRNVDTWWQWSLGLALPVAVVSACLDRPLLQGLLGLWDRPTPARMIFLASSALLLCGLARNSARLRRLLEASSPEVGRARAPRRAASSSRVLTPCND